nr:MAG TPA: hypothetical protein [Caudoviricetes sp.]
MNITMKNCFLFINIINMSFLINLKFKTFESI